MNKKKKILIITGSRAEYGLLKPIVVGLMKSKKIKPHLLVTGMHTLKKFGSSINEIIKDKIPIKTVVKISEKDDMLISLTKEMLGIRKCCYSLKPDLILVLGDRDEAFAGAIAGGHLRIPVAHIHGGDVTGFVVDEYIRHSITKFSHLHFVASKKSYNRIIGLGEEGWRVFVCGAPGIDSIRRGHYVSKNSISKKFGFDKNKKWLLIIHHPTPLDQVIFLRQIRPLLECVKNIDAEKIIIYPNSDTGSDIFINEINKCEKNKNFHIYKNLPKNDFLNIMNRADILLGNSSAGIIESGYFRLPTVNIGNRQKSRERGKNVMDSNYNKNNIGKAITKALTPQFKINCQNMKSPYGDGRASEKIIKILEKYIDNKKLFLKKLTY